MKKLNILTPLAVSEIDLTTLLAQLVCNLRAKLRKCKNVFLIFGPLHSKFTFFKVEVVFPDIHVFDEAFFL